ncbi:hypothetical protein vseg_019921 [Gypsophila vaccaria]
MLDMVDHGFSRLYGKNTQSSSNDDQVNNGNYNDGYGCDYQYISSNEETSFKQAKNTKQEHEKSTQNKRKSSSNAQIGKSRVVIRETLDVNDPIEAANSSVWSTLRVKNDDSHRARTPTAKRGLFGGVQVPQHNGGASHDRRNNPSVEASSMLREFNPAAFSRSLSFHEIAR